MAKHFKYSSPEGSVLSDIRELLYMLLLTQDDHRLEHILPRLDAFVLRRMEDDR